jgi:hypothetical protein
MRQLSRSWEEHAALKRLKADQVPANQQPILSTEPGKERSRDRFDISIYSPHKSSNKVIGPTKSF